MQFVLARFLDISDKFLVFDLESKSYGTNETASKVRGFVEFITQPQFLFYLHFFQDIVSILKDVSLIFQRDTLLVCEVPKVIEKRLIKDLSVIDNGENIEFKDTILAKPSGRTVQKIAHTPQAQ